MIDIKGALLNWVFLFALIAIIYFIWRAFTRLAGGYNKMKWPFGLLGLAAFTIGVNIGTLAEAILGSYVLSGLLRLPFAILTCWGLYQFLKTKWKKENEE